jgi:hypothetical protein
VEGRQGCLHYTPERPFRCRIRDIPRVHGMGVR